MQFTSFIDFLKNQKLNINNLVKIDFRPQDQHFSNESICCINGYVHYEINLGGRSLEFSLQKALYIHFEGNNPVVDSVMGLDSCTYDLDGIYEDEEDDYNEAQDLLNQYLSTELVPQWKTQILKNINQDELTKKFLAWRNQK